MMCRIQEINLSLSCCGEFLEQKAVWITALVIAILTLVTGSLILAQQYSGLGHSFSFLDKVPLGVTSTLFVIGGLFLNYSISQLVKYISKELFVEKGLVASNITALAPTENAYEESSKVESKFIDSSRGFIPHPRVSRTPDIVKLASESTKGDSIICSDLDSFDSVRAESSLELSDDFVYLGANQEKISCPDGTLISIPRTLHHLLFIYFALKSKNDKSIYRMLEFPIQMNKKVSTSQIVHEKDVEHLNDSTQRFHLEAYQFLLDTHYSASTTWGDLKVLITDLCNKFQTILNKKEEFSFEQREYLFFHFYRFCFQDNPTKFSNTVLKALAVEWSAPAETEILYRASNLSRDDIIREDGTQHSLSFSVSLFSGIVFEGTSAGTCTFSYYNDFHESDLYALKLSVSQLSKYFFYPTVFKTYGLLPLIAKGEFSHPRLKIFANAEEQKIGGVQAYSETARDLTSFEATEKIPDQSTYRKRIVKIYKKCLSILEMKEALN